MVRDASTNDYWKELNLLTSPNRRKISKAERQRLNKDNKNQQSSAIKRKPARTYSLSLYWVKSETTFSDVKSWSFSDKAVTSRKFNLSFTMYYAPNQLKNNRYCLSIRPQKEHIRKQRSDVIKLMIQDALSVASLKSGWDILFIGNPVILKSSGRGIREALSDVLTQSELRDIATNLDAGMDVEVMRTPEKKRNLSSVSSPKAQNRKPPRKKNTPRLPGLPVKTILRDQSLDSDHREAVSDYQRIKNSVKTCYQTIGTETQELLGLSHEDLAKAASYPASTPEERLQATEVIKAFKQVAAIEELISIHDESAPDSARRRNAAVSLANLGSTDYMRARSLEDENIQRQLMWQVLPPGWWNQDKYASAFGNKYKQADLNFARLKVVDSLGPSKRYVGSDKFGSYRYWVFVFKNHVVAECPLEGNALYVITGTQDWRNLLRRSKSDLSSNYKGRVQRIMHVGDWESRLKRAIR